jgi:hypothetical protein
LKYENVNGGRLFDDGENVLFIKYNNESTIWRYPEIIGKGLFWCWLHNGAWPRWLHPMHMIYAIEGEEQINCIDVLKEYVPYLHNFVINLQSNSRDDNILSLWATSRDQNV